MVAIPEGPGQTVDASQILRELVALHLLHVQLFVRPVRVVGQAVVLGRENLLVRLSTPGKLSEWLLRLGNFRHFHNFFSLHFVHICSIATLFSLSRYPRAIFLVGGR